MPFIFNDANKVLVEIEPGKLKYNKKIQRVELAPQSAQKGDATCFAYAGKVLHWYKSQNKYIPKSKQQGLLTVHRSAVVALTEQLNKWATLKQFLVKSQISAKKAIIDVINKILGNPPSQISKESLEVWKKLKDQYEKSTELDVFVFMAQEEYRQRAQIHENFLLQLNVDIEKEYQIIKKEYLFPDSLPDTLKSVEKDPQKYYHFLHDLYIDQVARIFDLQKINWNPAKSPDDLMKIISEKGPILINAFLGKGSYKKEIDAKKIDDPDSAEKYEIFSFAKENHLDRQKSSHEIVVLGIRKSPKPLVYYFDPQVACEPNKKRIVYMVSYDLFCQQCVDIHGQLGINQEPLRADNFSYSFGLSK